MMLCERCGKREATVNVVCVVNNTRVSKWLCETCAKEFATEGVLSGQNGEGARNILEEIFKPLRKLAEQNYYEEAVGQKNHFYTELAERILATARRTANQRQQEEIGTEHILWAMLQEPESQAAHLLLRCGVDKYTLLGELETWMGKSAEGANPVTYTKEASRAMEYAKSFADADGLYLISSGHILLGLLAEDGCVAERVLQRFAIDMNRVQVMMHEEFIETHSLPEKNKFKSQAKKEKAEAEMQKALKLLKGFGRNLNELAAQDKLDPVLGREKELEHVMRILCRRTKNNPVLIGESGVGKTAVAEGLAQRIVNGEAPEFLSDKIIFSLELGYVVAGAKYRGELEERLRNIIEAVKHCPRIVLFMDELQMLMNGGDGTMNIANIIKPALARGELHVIGATTLEDYRKSVEKDAALERRFQPVRVDAPDAASALKILKRLCGRYEKYHHVQVTEDALEAAVKLSDRYITDRNLPDKAIDILDEACASVRLHSSKDYSGQMGDPVVDADTVRQ
ncbi:MAG: AAA family ATPase, partial [Acidaminococcaceae bacterium]|nr:AAA family ATPase [Acidaminococcaceae bacterium]